MCESCLAQFRGYTAQRKASGSCIRCGKENLAVAAQMCLKCWFKKMASDCLRARGADVHTKAAQLEELWAQQSGRCAITGETLVPGVNASLDHILPKSRGGSDDVKNTQWVEFHINRAKGDLTHTEFLRLCRRVLRHAARDAKTGLKNERLADTVFT
jgi:hypothetical protein